MRYLRNNITRALQDKHPAKVNLCALDETPNGKRLEYGVEFWFKLHTRNHTSQERQGLSLQRANQVTKQGSRTKCKARYANRQQHEEHNELNSESLCFASPGDQQAEENVIRRHKDREGETIS